MGYPIQFRGQAYIRVGSSIKKLNDHPAREKNLWQKLSSKNFEKEIALENLSINDVLDKLDYKTFCEYKQLTVNNGINQDFVIEKMQESKLIKKSKGRIHITNLGAILWANDIDDFSNLSRKANRLIVYKGIDRLNAVKEIVSEKGCVAELPIIVDYIFAHLPIKEEMEGIFRKERLLYPKEAVRELVLNALMHQDFGETGVSTMVEIFSNRIEIRNPSKPLVSTYRFVDTLPKSRNETLARELRQLGLCEERGMGIDKVVDLCEINQLPAPTFRNDGNSTTVILYAPIEFSKMSKDDKVRATYLHTCLKYVRREFMTNQSLRERLQVNKSNYPQISKIINYTMEAGLIHYKNPKSTIGRNVQYIPFWVKPSDIDLNI